jgi:pimeloyl-ACP methyl ester carboxylesterase
MHATSGRARVAYEVTGGDGGADVLLIHAGVNDRRGWHAVIERLAPRHRCIALDMRGYGETDYEPEDGWSPVADALAVLDDAGVTAPAVVVACSMGGQTAVDLALAHPDRVGGLLLIGSAIRGAPYPELTEGPTFELNARFEQAEAEEDIEELERLDAWMWLDGPAGPEGRVGGPVRDLFIEMNRIALRAPDPGAQAELPDAWPRLGEISVPTLILVGRLDAEDVRAVDELAAGLIPGARLRFLDGVAHVPHLERDPTTIDEIGAFVDAFAAAR